MQWGLGWGGGDGGCCCNVKLIRKAKRVVGRQAVLLLTEGSTCCLVPARFFGQKGGEVTVPIEMSKLGLVEKAV